MRRPADRPSKPAPPAAGCMPASAPSLPAWKAFVVQFSCDSSPRRDVFAGRVEHLHSGRQARFASTQELLAALTRMLDGLPDDNGS